MRQRIHVAAIFPQERIGYLRLLSSKWSFSETNTHLLWRQKNIYLSDENVKLILL